MARETTSAAIFIVRARGCLAAHRSSGGTPNSYSITVPANTVFDVIVNESFSGAGVANYTLKVNQVPEPSSPAALALGFVLWRRGSSAVLLTRAGTEN